MYNIDDLRKMFNNKKVFMTGHTGFKGSYMCVLLKVLGAKVYGYSLKPEKDSLYEILKNEYEEKNDKLVEEEVYDDIRNYDSLYNFIKKVEPDFVIHMAAQPLVIESFNEPRYTYDVNVMGTVNLFEAIRNIKSNKKISVLNVTTDKVYENKDIKDYKFKESDNLKGDDPYANSKSCSELVTHSYKYSFFNDDNIIVSTARAGNVIGGGDFSKDRIVPDIFRAKMENKNVVLRNPDSTRPYQFVLEPLFIYLNILIYQYEDKKYEGAYNIGPDAEDIMTTKELAEKFVGNKLQDTRSGGNLPPLGSKMLPLQEKHKEKQFLCLDNSLIKKIFNYKRIYDNDQMVKNTTIIYEKIINKEKISSAIEDLCNSIS